MVGGYNKGRHVERCVAVAWGTALAKPWQARPILEAMRDQGCRQVQGYSGSSRAGIKPAVCLWLVQGFSSEPEVGHRALCLVAAIALSGEDRSGGRLPRFWSVRHVERRGNLAAWILHMRRAINRGRGSGEPALDLGVGRWA